MEPNYVDAVGLDSESEHSGDTVDMVDDEAFDMASPVGRLVEVDSTVGSDTVAFAGADVDTDSGVVSVEAKEPGDSQGNQGIAAEAV